MKIPQYNKNEGPGVPARITSRKKGRVQGYRRIEAFLTLPARKVPFNVKCTATGFALGTGTGRAYFRFQDAQK